MTQYENEPFIVGHYTHSKIEFMPKRIEFDRKWYSKTSFYTNTEKPIFGFAAISRPGKVFILGGCYEHSSSVSMFKNHKWEHNYDQLTQKRINFMTISYGTNVIIFGGTTENS